MPLGKYLWENTFEKMSLGKYLWENAFGKMPLEKCLWKNAFGKIPIDRKNFEIRTLKLNMKVISMGIQKLLEYCFCLLMTRLYIK